MRRTDAAWGSLRSVVFLLIAVVLGGAAGAPTGDLHRSYIFAPTGSSMPYRLYVPRQYDGAHTWPLVIVLHGAGGSPDGVFAVAQLQQMAEQRRFLLLAPLGYSPFGAYGNIYPVVVSRETAAASAAMLAHPPTPAGPRNPPMPHPPAPPDDYTEQAATLLVDPATDALSEAETLAALSDVMKTYTIDRSRIYLMGNSMGGVGTLYLAARYPGLFAAIAPSGGVIAAWSYPYLRLKQSGVAVLFVHGALDEHANAAWSRAMAEHASAAGVDARLLVVPGGHHSDGWVHVLPQIFDFFGAHARPPAATYRQDPAALPGALPP